MIIIALLFLFLVIYYGIPKGNPVHEIIHLLSWWAKMWQIPTKNKYKTKIHYGKHRRQYLLLFEPLNRKITKNNIIIYIHGGGWQFGTPEAFSAHAQFLTNMGYAVIMPSHRRIPLSQYYEMREDLNLIGQKILDIQKERNWGEKKWIISGMSSGGNLASHFALNINALNQIPFPYQKINGLMLFGAPLDLTKMYWSPVLYFFAGKKSGNQFANANPINYLNQSLPYSILIIHGTKDGLVSYKNVTSFIEKLNTFSLSKYELITLEKGTHLDAASWTFKDCSFQLRILEWLTKKEMYEAP